MMSADHGGIDHLNRLGRGAAIGECLQENVPEAFQAPSSKLLIDRIPIAKLFGQIAPGRPCARDPENTIERAAMLAGSAGLFRHKWLEKSPFLVAHQSANQFCLPRRGSLESYSRVCENPADTAMDSYMKLDFLRLTGRFVQLDPFVPELKGAVRAAIDCDPETWAIMPVNRAGEGFENYWAEACGAPTDKQMAYAIRQRSDQRVIGISTYDMTHAAQGGVEIGGTFLHPDARGGNANPEAKMLMLGHAFDSGAVRVQFSVDTRNKRSQAAMTKLGAVKEGVLRRNRRTWTGYIRDTAVFSILDHEWPTVKLQLARRLAQTP